MHEVQRSPIRPTRHVSPPTLDAALALLAEHRERARVVAGGTDVLVELDRRVGGPVDVLVDVTRIRGLDLIVDDGTRISLGPLVTHNQCVTSAIIEEKALPLAQACWEIGAPALRNRATVVGNVVTASPANDTISALHVLGATVTLQSAARGERRVPIAAFHTGVRATVREPDELVTALSFPPLAATERGVFVKLGLRRAQAISVVHGAVVCVFDDDGVTVVDARIALGSVAPTIVRMSDAEESLRGGVLDDEAIAGAARAASAAVQPIDDRRASADYRRDQVGVMLRRALRALSAGREREGFPDVRPTLRGPSVDADGVPVDVAEGGEISVTVNGATVRSAWLPGSLLDWIRAHPALTGTKEGCAEGECGACTIHLDGTAVLACLVPAGRAHGARLTTIEGLANPTLDPIQQAFVDCAAVQCGYCIPGFVMAGAALVADGGGDDRPSIRAGLAGNICRCTGYVAIEHAVQRAATGVGPGSGTATGAGVGIEEAP